jgi:hypothetical protein
LSRSVHQDTQVFPVAYQGLSRYASTYQTRACGDQTVRYNSLSFTLLEKRRPHASLIPLVVTHSVTVFRPPPFPKQQNLLLLTDKNSFDLDKVGRIPYVQTILEQKTEFLSRI